MKVHGVCVVAGASPPAGRRARVALMNLWSVLVNELRPSELSKRTTMGSGSSKVLIALIFLSGAPRGVCAKVVPEPENSSNTIPMRATTSTVSDCIKVEAVLLSHKPAAMLFGGYVANNFAVVKTTISNSCPDQQFIVHDIYFDYSDWALSGVYKQNGVAQNDPLSEEQKCKPESAKDAVAKPPDQCSPADTFIKGTNPGQVGTVGALDVEYQEVEDSEFSPRNKVVKALTLIGAVAQGYAFVGSGGAAMGIGAFNTAFVGSVTKLWPDRRVDQEKYLLSLGYRTDQSTAIAKDGHGSYYAFFPLATFLEPELESLFLSDPAVFLNPVEAIIGSTQFRNDNGGHPKRASKKHSDTTDELSGMLLSLARALPLNGAITTQQLLLELGSACPGPSCPYTKGDDVRRVLAEKHLFSSASLNAVKIVARGVMTIDVDSIPPTIDDVKFDDEKTGCSLWSVDTAAAPAADAAPKSAKVLSGQIIGKFLSGGTPSISVINAPELGDQKTEEYIADASLLAVSAKSSEKSLAFTLKLSKTVPSGSKLTFQVSRTNDNAGADASTASSIAGSSTTVTSNKYVYSINCAVGASKPTLTLVTITNDAKADVWQAAGTLSGTASGTDLSGATIAISSLEVNGKTVEGTDYIGAITEVRETSSDTKLDFQLKLLKPVPDGSKLTFVVSTKSGSTTLTSEPKPYTVMKPKPIKALAKKAAKPAVKPLPAH